MARPRMQAFTCTGLIFRHTITANSFGEALQVALAELGGGRVVLWATPDVWTRRAVEAAPLPGVVDAVPRFVVERGNGFAGILELDHDNLPGNLRPGEADRLRQDSETHAAWLEAFEAVHAGGEALKRHVVDVATCRDPERHRRFVRALAGACGLGPVPLDHGRILPLLVALDLTVLDYALSTPDDWFERDRLSLNVALDELMLAAAERGAKPISRSIYKVRDIRAGCSFELAQLRSQAGLSKLGWCEPPQWTA